MNRTIGLLALLLVVLVGAPASARPKKNKKAPAAAPAPAPAPTPAPAPVPPPVVQRSPEAEAKEAAVRLLGEGIERYQAGDYQGAVARFYAAYEIVPSAKIYLNIANALVKLGRDPEAADGYERFLTEAASAKDIDEDKRTLARTELERLQKRLGRLRVIVKPATATVQLDGKPIDTAAKPIYVTPGAHELSIAAHGYIPRQEKLGVEPGVVAEPTYSLELVPPPEQVVARKHAVRSARTKKIWGAIIGVAGLGVGGVGVKYLLDSRDLKASAAACTTEDPCTANQLKSYDDKGDRANTLSTVFFAAGGALVVTGTVLFIVGVVQGGGESAPPPPVSIAPARGGAIASWSVPF